MTKTRKFTVTIRRMTINAELRAYRKQRGLTCRDLAIQLDISRDYLKKMLRRRKPWLVRPGVEARFRELQAATTATDGTVACTAPQTKTIYSRYAIRDGSVNHVRATKCRGHRTWHLFASQRQVYCNAECKRLWRQRQGRKQHERRSIHRRGRVRAARARIRRGQRADQ